jgi:hypothetical protein
MSKNAFGRRESDGRLGQYKLWYHWHHGIRWIPMTFLVWVLVLLVVRYPGQTFLRITLGIFAGSHLHGILFPIQLRYRDFIGPFTRKDETYGKSWHLFCRRLLGMEG